MTSTNPMSSGAKANLVSSSPELLTRPASKLGDTTQFLAGVFCTSPVQPVLLVTRLLVSPFGAKDKYCAYHWSPRNRLWPDDRANSSTDELCTSVATALPFPWGEGVLPQPRHAHSLFAPDFPTRNEFLKLNLAAIFRLQPLAVSPQSSAFALHLSSQGRHVATSPCRSESLVVRFSEILLRFAETSQQTLRHFLLLPTTYINFPGKNALKLKKLRHLTHPTIC